MPVLRPRDTILFQGDSITDAGRASTPDNLGGGYVAILRGLLEVRHPELALRVENRGVGGNRTAELLERWKPDCEDLKPQVLSLSIGVNDVWRLRGLWNGQTFIDGGTYRENYVQLLERARKAGVRDLVLLSPTTIAEDHDSELARLLDERTAIVKELAARFGATYVPMRETQKAAMAASPGIRWTNDGCHPTVAGHALMAETWMKAVGL